VSTSDVTSLLLRYADGESTAFDRLLPLVYEELQRLARHHRYRWGSPDARAPGTTSLVHEAYARLVDLDRTDWECRGQFFAVASRAMRSVLIDNARWHAREKRGGDRREVPLEVIPLVSSQRSAELLDLDGALDRLEETDSRLARIVECRFFGGLTIPETAEAVDVSEATVKRGWNLARAWLYRELEGARGEPEPGA